MTAIEFVDRHLRHGLLRADRVVVRRGRRPERVYRSYTLTLRVSSYRANVCVSMSPDHHIEAPREGAQLTAERKLKAHDSAMAKYAGHWRWIAGVGLAATAIGLIMGVAAPGRLTGVVFPIGITVLLVVAYAARPRSNAPPTAR